MNIKDLEIREQTLIIFLNFLGTFLVEMKKQGYSDALIAYAIGGGCYNLLGTALTRKEFNLILKYWEQSIPATKKMVKEEIKKKQKKDK